MPPERTATAIALAIRDEGLTMLLMSYKARMNRVKALSHLKIADLSGRKHKRPALLLSMQYMVSEGHKAA